MHLQLMHQPLHMCTDEWHQTVSTLCPLSLPYKKAQAVSPSYA